MDMQSRKQCKRGHEDGHDGAGQLTVKDNFGGRSERMGRFGIASHISSSSEKHDTYPKQAFLMTNSRTRLSELSIIALCQYHKD